MFKHYLKLARLDHWFKNIFMLPGILLALVYFRDQHHGFILAYNIVAGILSTCFIASANYTINEWLDASFDKFHPLKKNRSAVTQDLKHSYVYLQYALFAMGGFILSYTISVPFLLANASLLFMGIVYNVYPMRSKEKAYIDVISESINNPIRLVLGWYIVTSQGFPPASLLISYWMGGAFLMATKRFSEYRFINDPDKAGLYRSSFKYYNEERLLISMFFYALTASFFLAIFLIKHRIELLISFPFFALLFAWYLKLGFKKDSSAQRPEKMYKEKGFVAFVILFSLLIIGLFLVDMPFLYFFLEK